MRGRDARGVGGEGAQDGCGWGTEGASSGWLTWVLGGGAWLRRRRVKGGGALLWGALVIVAAGCHTDGAMEEETGGSEGMLTSASSSSSGGEGEVDRRMFGRFYDDNIEVGYINAPLNESLGRPYYFWGELEIHADGTLVTSRRLCDGDPEILKFTWEGVGGGQLWVVPEVRNPNGTFKYLASSVRSVMLSPGEGWDDVVEVIEHSPESGKPRSVRRLVRGRVCAEPRSEALCDFQFVGCDGGAWPMGARKDGANSPLAVQAAAEGCFWHHARHASASAASREDRLHSRSCQQ